MNPARMALRRPVTWIVVWLAVALAGIFAFNRIRKDIFPVLDLPVLYVCQPYGGMDPGQMEGLLANYYEYHFLYINGIKSVETRCIQGVALMKLQFHPGSDMAQGLAETVAQVNRSRAFMPPGTLPPFVMRYDAGSAAVGYLLLSSPTLSVGQIQDQALFKVRPMFAAIPGVSAPPPMGGSQRTIVVRVDPDRLKDLRISPDDVARAISRGNEVSPSGAIRTADSMPLVPVNSMVTDPAELGAIPLDATGKVFVRDVAPFIEDATDITTGYTLVDGRRAVYLIATKRADASTLDVVSGIRAALPKMKAALPPEVDVRFEFDQSVLVTAALDSLTQEAFLGAILTGMMVLVFLRSWRGALVVVATIPIALLAAVLGLHLCGQTLNLMTLGGLALAIGILVDEATVEIENIHTRLGFGVLVSRAVVDGNRETAPPRLLALLCIAAVFTPALFLEGEARALFIPLSLAVLLAMTASYAASVTLVPVLAAWMLLPTRHAMAEDRSVAVTLLAALPRWRWPVAGLYLAVVTGVFVWALPRLGGDLFPPVESHEMVFRLRGPAGTRIEETEALTLEALNRVNEVVGAGNLQLSLAYVGQIPSSYPVNYIHLWMGGPEESVVRIRTGSVATAAMRRELRKDLLANLNAWARTRWPDKVQGVHVQFEPSDIVNQVMSLGANMPVEVSVRGAKLPDVRSHATEVKNALAGITGLADVQTAQSLEYPTLGVKIDREAAAMAGLQAGDVARALIAATSSTRFTLPVYWRDPGNGIGYQVQVEVPASRMSRAVDISEVPLGGIGASPLAVRDVGKIVPGEMPAQIDRFNMKREVRVTANLEGRDLASARQRVVAALAELTPPTGVETHLGGQLEPMARLSRGLAFGGVAAIVAIALLVLAYFQSVRLVAVVLLIVPGVLAGLCVMLVATATTISLPSLMGAILALGVGVAHAILYLSKARAMRWNGTAAREASAEALQARARPILMTGMAMLAGMAPMALGGGETGVLSAPLARAVMGGLAASILVSLLVLPSLFACLESGAPLRELSLDPDHANAGE